MEQDAHVVVHPRTVVPYGAKTFKINLLSHEGNFQAVKYTSCVIAAALMAATLSACGGGSGGTSASGGSGVGSASSSASSSSSSGSVSSVSTSTSMGQTAAARLLAQGTFGATLDLVNSTAQESYAQWFTAQVQATPSLTLPTIINAPVTQNPSWQPAWVNNVVLGPDQLRQRVAFALSEILVISDQGGQLGGYNQMLAYYYDTLVQDAFANYRQILLDVTLNPAMGVFLSLMRSDKPNTTTGVHADQNYAREVMQLFTIGLWMLNPDGSQQTDSSGNPIPTFTENDILNVSNALTGWSSAPTTHTGDAAWADDLNETEPMVAYEDHHDEDAKTALGVNFPAGNTAEQDLTLLLNTLFNHPNVGPFIGKQLIERLVTSNPSPAYVERVANVFNNDGTGTRGNMLAVVEAILTDPEAVTASTSSGAGKLREPLLRMTNLWRAFDAYNSGYQNVTEDNFSQTASYDFSQYPLDSPSVFNFFQPTYSPPGPVEAAGLVAPEFEITNEATLVNTNNFLQQHAYQDVDENGSLHDGPDGDYPSLVNANTVMLHTAEWEAIAASSPTTMVQDMNLVLMADQMPTAMQQTLINYASAIPATDAYSRVIETLGLLIQSPQYSIQR